MLNIIQGGHVKISSPSLRPRLYLYPGDKGYVGAGSATSTSPSADGTAGNNGTGCGPGGVGAADQRAESERQVVIAIFMTILRFGSTVVDVVVRLRRRCTYICLLPLTGHVFCAEGK